MRRTDSSSLDSRDDAMTRDQQRTYVQRWSETGPLLEALRWRELAALTPERALIATEALIDAALLVPLPLARRRWSGLVEQQRRFHRKRTA
jgi:hypothetical protein